MSYKLVVYVPCENADAVRNAIAIAGAGRLGKYTCCSFSTKGTGRFKPEEGAKPHIGTVGSTEMVEEERIEVTCDGTVLDDVIAAVRRTHPYEEIGFDIYERVDR